MWKGNQSGWRSWYGNTMCTYIFDGPRKHMDLLEQLIDVSNNPAIQAEDDPSTAHSKQTTSKRNKVESNDCSKKPRK